MNTALKQRSGRLFVSLIPLDDMVNEAIGFLREHEPLEGYFVGFSGGKDSIVTLELCRMAGVQHQAYYSCTGIDAPEVVQFIRRHYPKMTFWEGIRKYGPPSRTIRWCCDVLKKQPGRSTKLKNQVMGMRAEESARRAARGRISSFKSRIHFKPIFHWLEWHVWEFIDSYNLPYPSLYDEGYNRIGCIVCPFIMGKNQVRVKRNRERWPAIYRVFEKVVADYYANYRKKNDIASASETYEQYLELWYKGFSQ